MPPIPWETFVQLGGMSAVTAVLLWAFIGDRAEHTRTLKTISITMIGLQQLLLIQAFSKRHDEVMDCEECRRLLMLFEEIQRSMESQRAELERTLASK